MTLVPILPTTIPAALFAKRVTTSGENPATMPKAKDAITVSPAPLTS